jgi:hypothetical protein
MQTRRPRPNLAKLFLVIVAPVIVAPVIIALMIVAERRCPLFGNALKGGGP